MQAAPTGRRIGSAETPAGEEHFGRKKEQSWVHRAPGPPAKSTHWADGSGALPGASWGSEVAYPIGK